MGENVQRSRGRQANYKMDRGGTPAEFGPFYGIVKNNVDPTRSGRLQVYISTFSDGDENDSSKWTTVSYLPSFFGSTPNNPGSQGPGTYPGNINSYGMWFTPPDLEVQVLCIFANGDRSQGFYIGVVPEQSVGHMVPAIGASTNFVAENANQAAYFADAAQLPVTEINTNNIAFEESGRFSDSPKPIQSVVAAIMFQQGLITDPQRGPITSSSQRESPSACYGVSTPGTAIYNGGMTYKDLRSRADSADLTPQDVQVIGRMGGHSLVMDDGDIDGNDRLVRLRTAGGHQIVMSDSGNFFYMIHANGQVWMEFGSEGTVDVYATNSVNFRTQGDINFHADQDINMYANRNITMKSKGNTTIDATSSLKIVSQNNMTIYSKAKIGVKSDGSIALDCDGGSWSGGSGISLDAGGIDLNSGGSDSVTAPTPLTMVNLDDTSFNTSTGWKTQSNKLESIVTRAPAHEPWTQHNKGVDAPVQFEGGDGGPLPPPPGAPVVPPGVTIKAL